MSATIDTWHDEEVWMEAEGFADHQRKVHQLLKTSRSIVEVGLAQYDEQLASSLNAMERLVSVHNGIVVIQGVRPSLPPHSFARLLRDRDGIVMREFGSCFMRLEIPTTQVTGVHMQPQIYDLQEPQPTMRIRVRTSEDKPVSVFTAPGTVVSRPSDGEWSDHSLSSYQIELA